MVALPPAPARRRACAVARAKRKAREIRALPPAGVFVRKEPDQRVGPFGGTKRLDVSFGSAFGFARRAGLPCRACCSNGFLNRRLARTVARADGRRTARRPWPSSAASAASPSAAARRGAPGHRRASHGLVAGPSSRFGIGLAVAPSPAWHRACGRLPGAWPRASARRRAGRRASRHRRAWRRVLPHCPVLHHGFCRRSVAGAGFWSGPLRGLR